MQTIKTDIIIIGAGIAGISAAIAAQSRQRKVLMVCKGAFLASGSTFVNRNNRWGITYAESDAERDALLEGINRISRGTNTPELSRILVEESQAAFDTLKSWEVAFNRDEKGQIDRKHACFLPRPVAAIIESTGQLKAAVQRQIDPTHVQVIENCRIRTLMSEAGRCRGAVGVLGNEEEVRIDAEAVILAAGGRAAAAKCHIVEPGLTGDGYALLESAEIPLKNMEYVQRVWEGCSDNGKRFPISALWDGNHHFISSSGTPLAPVDGDAAASRKTHVPIANLQPDRRFDQVLLDAISDLSPAHAVQVLDSRSHQTVHRILPHAQACNGGVEIGPNGETGLEGLYAAGEVTTGMHGGDRIGGMMIASCIVFGKRAGQAAAARN